MSKSLAVILALLLSINTFAQDKKWDKILKNYQNHNYQQAIELSEKYITKKISNPGPYYVIGLSYFNLTHNLPAKTKQPRIKKAINYIHTGLIKDKDSTYYKLFASDLKQFKDSLQHWAETLYPKDKLTAGFYAQSIIYLFKDTTQIYRKIYPPKPNKPTSISANNPLIPQNTKINQTDARGQRQGLWIARYPNGNIKYEINFKNGHPIGLYRRYYPSGALLVEMKFDPTGHRAVATFYDMDGHRIAKGYYLDQKRDSIWQFFINDSIVLKEVMYKNGKKNGFERIYSPNYYPNLLQERYYKNGVLDSVAVDYYYDGTPKSIMFYKNGKLDGPFQLFYYGGQVKIKGQYKNDYMEGLWEFHNPDGTVDTVRYHLGQNVDKKQSEAETKILKAMEQAKGQIPEPEEMFKKQFGLQGDW